MSYSIRVMDSDGRAVQGASVSVHYIGLIGSYDDGHTDADGWVSLFTNEDGLIIDKVYVNGEEVSARGTMFPGDTLSVTI